MPMSVCVWCGGGLCMCEHVDTGVCCVCVCGVVSVVCAHMGYLGFVVCIWHDGCLGRVSLMRSGVSDSMYVHVYV